MSRPGYVAATIGDLAVTGFRGRLHHTTMTDDEQPTTQGPEVPRDPMALHFFPGATSAPFPTGPPPTDPPSTDPSPTAPASLADGPAVPPLPPQTGPAEQDVAPAGPVAPADLVADAGPVVPKATGGHRNSRKRRTLRAVVWAVAGVVVVSALVASRINLDYYAIQPGSAQPVQPYITVPPSKSHPVTHSVLLTDVREARVSALTYLWFKFQSDTELYSVPSVTGGTSADELDAQGALQMSQAEESAKTAALRHAGYAVPATAAGAVVTGTFAGTPAHGVLNVGDVITALNGTPTLTALALTTALAAHHAGETVTFTVRKDGKGAPVPVPLTLKRTKVEVGGQVVYLDVGIEPQDQVDYAYPFPISISVTDIGGPSAGLAMTLGVLDALTSGSLTGGHTIAATGTIDAAGNVGDVGGVAQKTVAVEKAGASLFLVPPEEYKAAMSKDRPGLKVVAVSTLDEALRVIGANGGKLSPTTLDAAPSH